MPLFILLSHRVTQWDVNNEYLHGDFFKSKTGDGGIINSMFQQLHARDSNSRLFLNDFNIVSSGSHTQVKY